MPLDKKKLDALLDEIKDLKETPVKKQRTFIHQTPSTTNLTASPVKKDFLLTTEKNAYFQINHHYRLVMLSVDNTATALEIWIKGILPLLLVRHGIDQEEWERICDLGDRNAELEEEITEDWKKFFEKTIQQGLIDKEILTIINEGRRRVEKMRADH